METLELKVEAISMPRIRDKAPKFKALTTQGGINFPDAMQEKG